MNFELNDEQQQLADSVHKFLASQYTFEQRRSILESASGCSDAVWATFADMGLLSIAVPQADGGFGGGALDLMPVMQACGEALVVEPLLDHVGLAGRLIASAGPSPQRAAWLRGLMDGSLRFAFAALEPASRYELAPAQTVARATGAGWVLDGDKCVVVGAAWAHRLIVSARTGAQANEATLFVLDREAGGVSLERHTTVDGQRCADVRLRGVELGADAVLGPVHGALALIEDAVDFATALSCAEAVGAMHSANDATLEYLKTRRQFGVPIGSFQVLQHRMVEMHITCEQARSMAILAAAKVDAPGERAARQRAVAMAKVKIADAARLISQESVQLHGGMGMTQELKVSHTFRRLTTLAQRFGDADHHLQRCAELD